MRNNRLLSLSLLLLTASRLMADPESSAFEEFQRAVRAADPKLIEKQLLPRDHSERQPTKEEAEKFVETITRGAVAVLDQANQYEKRFPSSRLLPDVRASVVESLWSVFGAPGLPIPPEKLADVESVTRKRMSEAPDDPRFSMILCRVAAGLPRAKQEALFGELSRETTPEPARSMASNALQKLDRIGRVLDLSFTAVDGRAVSPATLKGKVVVVDFWSTTCRPCLNDLPELKELYGKYKARGVEFIGISLDSDRSVLEQFIRKEQIPWPQYFDSGGFTNRWAREFGIRAIPVVWLVDRDGVLRDLEGRRDLGGKIGKLVERP